jgi:hypothetical protein
MCGSLPSWLHPQPGGGLIFRQPKTRRGRGLAALFSGWHRWSLLLLLLLGGLVLPGGSCALQAADEVSDLPPLTEEARKQAQGSGFLSLPSPGEFFAALAKGGRLQWSNAGRAVLPVGAADRPQIALNLGVLLADGYLAIQNQNGQMVKNVGRDLLDMARKLNAGEHVVARGRSINDFAENNDWNALREELEATQNEIKISLIEQKDEELVVLVALGAWLRSVQAGTALITSNFDPELASLLGQSGLAREFAEILSNLPERLRQRELIMVMQAGTLALAAEMDWNGRVPDGPMVEQLGITAAGLTARITGAVPELRSGAGQESTPSAENSTVEEVEVRQGAEVALPPEQDAVESPTEEAQEGSVEP